MKILLTGIAGFIGFSLARELVKGNAEIIGLDSINEYYDVRLKYSRLSELGIDKSEADILCSIKNVYSISLGERILRADTASQNIISILMYEFDKE